MIKKFFWVLFITISFVLASPLGQVSAQTCNPPNCNGSNTCDDLNCKPFFASGRSVACTCIPKKIDCGTPNICQKGNKCANPECVPVVGASGRSATCNCVPKANNPGGNVLSPVTPVPTRGSVGTTSGSSGPALDFAKIAGFAEAPLPDSLGEIISNFVPYVFGAAGIILFFYFIWGGFSWMMAKGDPKATAAARETITKAVVGFAIIFTAYWLTQILGKIFGVGQFNNIFQ